MSIRNLSIAIGIALSGDDKLKAADNAMSRLVARAENLGKVLSGLASVLAVGALVSGIEGFIERNVKAADALYNQAAKLGMTTDELQKYEYASQQMGITAQETSVAIRFFNRAVGEAQLGTKSAVKTFAQLGMLKDVQDPTAKTSDLLLKFSDTLEKIPSQGKRTAFVMRTLGRGGSAMLPILQQGSKKLRAVFEDLDEMGGGFDQKFAEDSHILELSLKKQALGWRTVSVAIIREALPAIQAWIDRGMVTVKWLIHLSKVTYGFRTALMFTAATLGVLAAAFVLAMSIMYTSLAPIIAGVTVFVGIMTALYIAFDDFYTFLQGGESVLGNFLEKLGGTGAAKKFRDDLVRAFDDVKKAFGFLNDSSNDFHKSLLSIFVESLPYIIKWGGIIVSSVTSKILDAVAGMRELWVVAQVLFGKLSGDEGRKQLLDIDTDTNKKLAALHKVQDLFESIDAPQTPEERAKSYAPGGSMFAGPMPLGTPQPGDGTPNLPPPPAPVHVHVTNHISGGTNGGPPSVTTKVKVNGETQNRNTHASVLEGMPSTAD